MRILLLTTHLNIGGISTYVTGLAKALKAKGHEVYVSSSGGVLVPELTEDGISHITLDIRTKSELSPKVFRAILEIAGIIKKLDINIVHANTRITQVSGCIASLLCSVAFVSTAHGFFTRNIGRRIFPCWGKQVIAISDAVRDHLVNDFKVDSKRISLIYNGIDTRKFLREFSVEEKDSIKQKYGIKKNCRLLGTIARFTPDKGHDLMLYAFFEILKRRPDVQLVFVGDGKEKNKVTDLVHQLGLEDNVVFIKPQINTVNILSIMDIFLFTPKRKEGLGIALLEALASGKAVVATNIGGIPSIIENGVNGFLIESPRPEFLVNPILQLLEDSSLYKKITQAGRERVIQKFSINGMVDRVEELYGAIL